MNRWLAAGAGLALATGCYQAWPFVGPYSCNDNETCPVGMVCDDGLCCRADGTPSCPTRVLDGGLCAGGTAPRVYFEDADNDGFGNAAASKLLCSKPVLKPYTENALACDDTSAQIKPNGIEICDGIDNNCDGKIDEGLVPVNTYFRDEDGDGFGNPAVTKTACAAPRGYVDNNSDCGPNSVTVHPGGVELCNGIDDDCNTLKDDNVTDSVACVSTGLGECAPGRTACIDLPDGGLSRPCQSVKTPKPEICDTLDNNCNGAVDEQPECGGPVSLRVGPGVVGGAQDLNRSLLFSELTAGCLKGTPGATGETWSVPTWTGTGGSDHILYFEAPSGTWDLSKGGLKLRLNMSWTMLAPMAPPWAASSQPVVYLCASGSFARYVHTSADGGTAMGSLLTTTSGSFTEDIPIAAGNQWVNGGGTNVDLKQIKRIEILVRPTGLSGASTPTFSFTVGPASGFVP